MFPSEVGFGLGLRVEFKFTWGTIKCIARGKFRVKFTWWIFGLGLNQGGSGVCVGYDLGSGLSV